MKVLRLDYVEVRDMTNAQGQQLRSVLTNTVFLSADGRQRIEKSDPDLSLDTVHIHDYTRDLYIRLDLKRKIAVRHSGWAKQRKALTGGPSPKQPLGTRIIQGFECHGSRTLDQSAEAWICRDPVSGREFFGSVSFQKPTGARFRTDLQAVTQDFQVNPHIFEIPPDFRIIDK